MHNSSYVMWSSFYLLSWSLATFPVHVQIAHLFSPCYIFSTDLGQRSSRCCLRASWHLLSVLGSGWGQVQLLPSRAFVWLLDIRLAVLIKITLFQQELLLLCWFYSLLFFSPVDFLKVPFFSLALRIPFVARIQRCPQTEKYWGLWSRHGTSKASR